VQFEVSQRNNVLLVPNAALRWRPQLQDVVPEARDEFRKSQRRRTDGSSGGAVPAAGAEKERHDRGTLWVQDGGFVRPIKVRTGLSDGAMTEIVSGDVQEGAAVVVGEIRQNGGDATTNPFTPQVFGGKKKE